MFTRLIFCRWLWPALLLAPLLAGCGGASYAKEAQYGGSPPPAEPAYRGGEELAVASPASLEADMPADRAAPGEERFLPPPPPPARMELAQRDARPRKSADTASAPTAGPAAATPVGGPEAKPAEATDVGPAPAAGAPAAMATPLLIYDARFQMAVYEVEKAISATEALGRELGGYLVQRDDSTIKFRVPAGKFDEALGRVAKLGDVLHRAIDVRDVTEEFADLQIRLQNARAMRQRFEELLARAQSVKDALEVQREIERVTAEIERFEGRLKLLRELIAFSTITVTFSGRPVESISPTVALPFPWLNQLGLAELLSL
ncbi:MAG: DUF4349 domain-containing protein [Deltaproteobacteria bacterium]|nr:DUF4349 domain-containing protein [Deltaproteobacteria bacterium]